MGLAEPVGLTPIFYLLPMLLAGYFLPRAEIAANFLLALLCCGITLASWVDPGLRLAMFMAVALIMGLVTGVVLALREQIRVLVTQLGELAIHDSLTGALNRGAFEQRLESELARTERMAAPCALVVFDVDHFKRINDTGGHAAGDAVLRALARAVMAAKRRSDIFGRIGGEEFAVVLPDTGLVGATTFAEKLRESLPATMGDVTVSFGVTDARTAGRTVHGMLHSADVALYDAKRRGRDRVVTAESQRPWGRQDEGVVAVCCLRSPLTFATLRRWPRSPSPSTTSAKPPSSSAARGLRTSRWASTSACARRCPSCSRCWRARTCARRSSSRG